MSETTKFIDRIPHPHSTTAATFAVAAAFNVAPAVADAAEHQVDPNENGPLPTKIEHYIARNVVYLDGNGCTGEAIRNYHDRVTGIAFTAHCDVRDRDNPHIMGKDGQLYMVQTKSVRAQIGEKMGKLKTVATIDKYILPPDNDYSQDIAIGVVKDQDPVKVLADYRRSSMTTDEIKKLRIGDDIYLGGWPTYQPGNKTKRQRRQSFRTTVLGLGNSSATKTSHVKTLWASVTDTKDRAFCTYGDSGGAALKIDHGKVRTVGHLTYVMDLTGEVPGTPNADPEHYPPPRLTGPNVAGVCGFAYEAPSFAKGAIIVNSVRSMEQIPGNISNEKLVEKARAEFKAPGPKNVINGIIGKPLRYGEHSTAKGRQQKGGPSEEAYGYWLSDAFLFAYPDAYPARTVIAWGDPADPDNLALSILENRYLTQQLIVYPHSQDNLPGIQQTEGQLEYSPDSSGQTSGSFTDGSRQYGLQQPTEPDYNLPTYYVAYENGRYETHPNMK